jgi:hypothetical protein
MNTTTLIKVAGTGDKKPCPDSITVSALFKLQKQTAMTTQLTTLSHGTISTPDYAIANLTQTTPFGFSSSDEGTTVLHVIENLQTRVAELEAILVAVGILA